MIASAETASSRATKMGSRCSTRVDMSALFELPRRADELLLAQCVCRGQLLYADSDDGRRRMISVYNLPATYQLAKCYILSR